MCLKLGVPYLLHFAVSTLFWINSGKSGSTLNSFSDVIPPNFLLHHLKDLKKTWNSKLEKYGLLKKNLGTKMAFYSTATARVNSLLQIKNRT